MALRGVGPESEAESVRFHGRRVTKVGPEVKHGSPEGWRMRGSIWPFQFGSTRDIEQAVAWFIQPRFGIYTAMQITRVATAEPMVGLSQAKTVSFSKGEALLAGYDDLFAEPAPVAEAAVAL